MALPFPLVSGPVRVPAQYGLFSALAPREGSTDRWEIGGVRWEGMLCEDSDLAGLPALDCDPEDDAPKFGLSDTATTLERPMLEATAFTVFAQHKCTPIGNSRTDGFNRASEVLQAYEEQRVEQALWTGDMDQKPNFADTSVVEDIGSEQNLLLAVARLQAHYAKVAGGQGLIHMSRYNAEIFLEVAKAEKRGGMIRTGLDTQVVAGTGYGDNKVVITSPLIGYRSDIFPTEQGDALLDRNNNDQYALAARSYLLGFDPCGAASVTLTIGD